MDGVLGKGFALEWSRFGILAGDFDGKAYFWGDMQSKLELDYGNVI